MMKSSAALWLWTPRIAGIAMSLFLAIFALDAFDGMRGLEAWRAFAIHLIPTLLVLAAVAIAWRVPLFGGLVCAGLAILYASRVNWRLNWILLIAGPLLIIAALFVLSARYAGGKEPPA